MADGYTLAEIANWVGASLRGDGHAVVTGMATLASAQAQHLAFLSNPKYASQLATTRAGAVLLKPEAAADFVGNALIVDNPYAAFAQLSHRFDRAPRPAAGVHASAQVSATARIADDVSIGPYVVVGEHVSIGAGTIIEAGCVISDRVTLGGQCHLHANVTIYHDCQLGDRVVIHSGSVIGADGFGFANQGGRWHKIAQIGAVRIGQGVEIGANTTVDRGALDDTVIHDGVIIDNQVQIAHNVVIGPHTAIAACCGISGSTTIGAHCVLAGGVGVVGHISICDGVHVTGMTMITKSITEPGAYSSGTAFDRTDLWKRMAVRLRKLDDLFQRVAKLELTDKSRV